MPTLRPILRRIRLHPLPISFLLLFFAPLLLFLGLAPNPVVNPHLPQPFRENDKLLHATAFAVLAADVVWCWTWRRGTRTRGRLGRVVVVAADADADVEADLDVDVGVDHEAIDVNDEHRAASPSGPDSDSDTATLLTAAADTPPRDAHSRSHSLVDTYRRHLTSLLHDTASRRLLLLRLAINTAIMLCAAVVSEVFQHLVAPHRTFDPHDILANTVGVSVGIPLAAACEPAWSWLVRVVERWMAGGGASGGSGGGGSGGSDAVGGGRGGRVGGNHPADEPGRRKYSVRRYDGDVRFRKAGCSLAYGRAGAMNLHVGQAASSAWALCWYGAKCDKGLGHTRSRANWKI
ncbi:hypothetical protein M427DRAFT_507171 [Gonapodya prolifera JEL478]|uniref:VanZ-like domain-containing protein n=1 Tax=Gonapodya prolifera (strain JEL478) TaxID=1344416 RepID=A0A139A357_GONPJ|nr:hypothetical protein M427DRAFT_507171 [Gonapodya prolifera JEL478]|eukprot:KXS10813.1 hypothetical protein M427DRAFT_507171 [Gonapodya prolifera JEL478]